MQRLKFNWIGLNLSPPLLLGLQEGVNEAEERKEWTEIEKNAGFYPQEGTSSKEPWDVREATRAMNELHINNLISQRVRNTFIGKVGGGG